MCSTNKRHCLSHPFTDSFAVMPFAASFPPKQNFLGKFILSTAHSGEGLGRVQTCVLWKGRFTLLNASVPAVPVRAPGSRGHAGTTMPSPCPCFLSRPFSQVTQYLLDQSFVMDEESLYESSLRIEPKPPT